MHSPRWRSSATTETRSSTTSRDEVDHDDHHFFYHHQKLISGNHGLNTKHQIYSETKININIFISLFAIVIILKKRNGQQRTMDVVTYHHRALTHWLSRGEDKTDLVEKEGKGVFIMEHKR